MKALIAATCVALLAAVGYYFWNEHSEAKAHDKARVEYLKRSVEDECNEAARLLNDGAKLGPETRRMLIEKFDRCSAYAH
ncbi:hypothetical protein HNR59_002870 [Aquamicrobium lusatiense]|uniref:Uncharacterized protein n=1 Tax=Aquamicrobium lusatiense TaxID=89772 RepID=A0A7W9S3L6_9HYPH|nr:hypothetical protein [Aquamicrobium lusatiense]